MSEETVDIAIAGGGPAGITAGIYAVRTGRSALLLEQLAPGGQAATTWRIDNYPGAPHVNGAELMLRMEQQARELGLVMQSRQVTGLQPGRPHRLDTSDGALRARAVILATGARPRPLQIPGEVEFRGRGVSYCATCDGAFFRDVPVAVIGGGNAALEEADFLTRFASKVYVIHRREHFRADQAVQNLAAANPKIEFLLSMIPTAIHGGDQGVTGLQIGPRTGTECRDLPVKGVFIFAGLTPQTEPFREVLETDADGYLVTAPDFSTKIPGVFAAGDCRANWAKQIVTAAGEGAAAAMIADRYLQQQDAA